MLSSVQRRGKQKNGSSPRPQFSSTTPGNQRTTLLLRLTFFGRLILFVRRQLRQLCAQRGSDLSDDVIPELDSATQPYLSIEDLVNNPLFCADR